MHEQEQGGLIQHLPPFGVTWNAEQSESAAVRCSGPGGEAKCHLCVLSPPLIGMKRLETCLCVCGYGVSQYRNVLDVAKSSPGSVIPGGSGCVWPLGELVSPLGQEAGLISRFHPVGPPYWPVLLLWLKESSQAGVSPRDHCTGCKST